MLNRWPANIVRDVALREIMKHVHYEDESTNYINVCPISKVMYATDVVWSNEFRTVKNEAHIFYL